MATTAARTPQDSVDSNIVGCEWAGMSPIMSAYHDTEWGVPVHDDRKLFEYLVLDAFQAGLSWAVILNKREGFRSAFANFEPHIVAAFTDKEVAVLAKNTDIVRNRAKIAATVGNAQAMLRVVEKFGSFDRYLWSFTEGTTMVNSWTQWSEIPAETAESKAMSDNLRAQGFRFVGPTICYAIMQSAGMVNDHVITCPRYQAVMNPAADTVA